MNHASPTQSASASPTTEQNAPEAQRGPDLDQLRAAGIPESSWHLFGDNTLGTLMPKLGLHFDDFTVERVEASMPVAENTQIAGLLHGGATAALAETVGSLAAALHAPENTVPVGVDLNITHHRGVREGHIHAVATPVHLGRTTTTHTIDVTDDRGKRVASARITNQLIRLNH